MIVRRKMEVGRADDPLEVEAERTADEVSRLLSKPGNAIEVSLPALEGTRIRRMASKADRLGGTDVSSDIEFRISSQRGRGSALDESTKVRLGSAFGADFSGVRVHTDNAADQLSRSLDSRAFTVGNDIFFRSGEQANASSPNPLLAHELTHVLQQSGGTAQRSIQRVIAPADLAAAELSKAEADKRQVAARDLLKGYVEEGATSTDRRLKNSCLMILQGKAKMFALTLAGDTTARVTAKGKKPAKLGAWLPEGTGDIMSPATSYNHLDLSDNTNIDFDDFSTLGASCPAGVLVYDPAKQTKLMIFETLRHELQHAFDGSKEKKAEAQTGTDPALIRDARFKFERYKTEYRAYNYEGATETEAKSSTKTVDREGYTWTERQRHVFEQIYDSYPHTEDGWDNNLDLGGGKKFRDEVVAYVNPDSEGFNKYNSPKVDELYKAVNGCAVGAAETDSAVVTAITKIGLLDNEDAKAIVNENPDWVKHVNKKFSTELAAKILELLRQKAA